MITGRQAGLAWLFKVILRFYKKVVSPALPPSCRFYPTCADYAHRSVELHGPAKGLVLALRRFSRCHPFNPGGYDPVNQPASLAGPTGNNREGAR
ncbi:MAG: membrane protein insertion efficiency factor YidD [Deltaproteobacteria bacterium]|nr:membrane protein insertion efficiency factor YidD [Deltaproteobacteria bacterium]